MKVSLRVALPTEGHPPGSLPGWKGGHAAGCAGSCSWFAGPGLKHLSLHLRRGPRHRPGSVGGQHRPRVPSKDRNLPVEPPRAPEETWSPIEGHCEGKPDTSPRSRDSGSLSGRRRQVSRLKPPSFRLCPLRSHGLGPRGLPPEAVQGPRGRGEGWAAVAPQGTPVFRDRSERGPCPREGRRRREWPTPAGSPHRPAHQARRAGSVPGRALARCHPGRVAGTPEPWEQTAPRGRRQEAGCPPPDNLVLLCCIMNSPHPERVGA